MIRVVIADDHHLVRRWLSAPVVIERLDGKREVQGGQTGILPMMAEVSFGQTSTTMTRM